MRLAIAATMALLVVSTTARAADAEPRHVAIPPTTEQPTAAPAAPKPVADQEILAEIRAERMELAQLERHMSQQHASSGWGTAFKVLCVQSVAGGVAVGAAGALSSDSTLVAAGVVGVLAGAVFGLIGSGYDP